MLELNELKLAWGSFEIDANGNFLNISSHFCEHFNVEKQDLIDKPFTDIIDRVNLKKVRSITRNKDILFAIVNKFPCLLKVIPQSEEKGFSIQVILKYEETYKHEILALLNFGETRKKSTQKRKRNRLSHTYTFDQIIGNSTAIQQVKELAAKVSRGSSTVLLTGESGTGKELFAQAIHDLSSRKEGPFVPINCAAIPENLFESELFGYEGGAFSGARKEGKPGKIELAQNGTLFLDEISELPLIMQGKLLRVLQEREVERLGGTGKRSVDIRIIAATNRDLNGLIQEGKFRQDLYYRLLVFELKIPPLRDREDDILLLVDQFIQEYNQEFGKEVNRLDPELKDWILT